MKHSICFSRRVAALARVLINSSLVVPVVWPSSMLHADVLDRSLKLRFAFDAPPAGEVIADTSSSAAHSGANHGATWVASHAGRSGVMRFDGFSLNRIVVGAAPDLNSRVGTIAFWLKSLQVTPTPRRYAMVFDRRTSAGDLIYQDPNGHLANQAQQANGARANSQTTVANVTDGGWHHIAYAYDQGVSGSSPSTWTVFWTRQSPTQQPGLG
jgi:Concanavalin A-like lectin/glucanases superfamily